MKRRGLWFFIPLMLLAACLSTPMGVHAQGEEIERAVVRIVNYSQRGDWYTPWNKKGTRQGRGSGFVVEGGRIMTNAHMVSDSRACMIFLHGDPNPHPARVVAVGHDCDLALIEPMDPNLLDGIKPLTFGSMPSLRSTVDTYGYPAGGRRISSTRGVVSRIEIQLYSHSGADAHLTVQTDAAINPGNSGGPVVQDGLVVGVAFQGAGQLENVGYVIPTEVVRHFLDDMADGTYDGYPDLGISTGTMENPAQRRVAGMAEGESGVIVTHVFPGSSADGVLTAGDVLLSIEGYDIANDSTVSVDGMRFKFGVVTDKKQAGDKLQLVRLRQGEKEDVTVTVEVPKQSQRFSNINDALPRYYVYAGLVFAPLEREFLKTFGDQWRGTAPKALMHEYLFRNFEEPQRLLVEPVVLTRSLDHPVNMNLPWRGNLLVKEVNGVTIDSMNALVEAVESNTGPYHVIEFDHGGRFQVLDRKAADEANAEILELYGVQEDRRL